MLATRFLAAYGSAVLMLKQRILMPLFDAVQRLGDSPWRSPARACSKERAANAPPPAEFERLARGVADVILALDDLREGGVAQDRELPDHFILRLIEIVERAGVQVIAQAASFDRRMHRPSRIDGLAAEGATLGEIATPGLRLGDKVLLRARVRLLPEAKRLPSPNSPTASAADI